MSVRAATSADAGEWLRMRQALWPDESSGEHQEAIDRFFDGRSHEPLEALLALDERGAIIGFVELSIRNIVDGCSTDRVGYLEGWYVDPHARRRGVGRALIAAAERWALSQGCTEFGSDVLVDNDESLAAHEALGFQETSRVCCLRKDLKPE
jgi:aminoglycoside 6'-N-acetyltransferase I